MVINKPAGMAVHPIKDKMEDTLANAVTYYWCQRGESRLFRPINRLDKGTSGLVLVGKSQYAHQAMFNSERLMPMFYKTIKEIVIVELIIKKSRFISLLIPINQLQDVEKELHDAKQKYPDANHYCLAYIIRQDGSILERCSDDGEPSGTAGWPILNVLKTRYLENVVAIVIRYFGGTLLGTGGLVKAYTQSVKSTLDAAQIVSMEYAQKIVVTLNYSHYGSFEKQFSNIMSQIADIQYTERVRVELWIAVDKLHDFMAKVVNLSLGTATMELCEEGFVPQLFIT
ncbi:MAG: YigZ family protein [Syntrophomonas sp.]|nr:YigZ family protein [Syntrophomonas sp.]